MDEPEQQAAEPTPAAPRRRWRGCLLATLIALAPAIDAVLIEPNWVEVTQHSLGEGPRAVRVLQLTDLHIGAGQTLDGVLATVRELAPDLIVITGDSVVGTRPVTPQDADAVVAVLEQLEAPLGVYACPGNHEAWAGTPGFEVYRRAGVPLLSQDAVTLLDGALVVHGRQEPSDAVEPSEAFDLVLCHYPTAFDHVEPGVELVLAGHTHGGQVRLPFVGALWLPRGSGDYTQGWFQQGDTRMYVCRGVGTSILPIRFLCRPEVALFTIRLPE